MRASTLWKILSVVFFTIGIIAGLGEWVFHWWNDPGQWITAVGLLLGLLSYAVSASSSQVEALRVEQAQRFDRQEALLTRLAEGQERLVQAQERLAQAQERHAQAQERLAEGQERLLHGQDGLQGGQAEQTRLLRELVASFRPREPS